MRRVLVANRGEIAVRIIRACRDAGIAPVAVYSDVDRAALHVRMADRAVGIGPPAPRESYLNIPRLVEAALEAGCQGVHPGYGFLAENATFAQACTDAGLIFIGPGPDAIRRMGSKIESRRTAAAAGVEVVPGSRSEVTTAADVRRFADAVGYPVVIKASAGGGGKGMRLVRSPEETDAAFAEARGEAGSAFADATVYLEKYLARPRHIEIQIFADTHGNCVHLGERECSVQRRHQKLVEESPSPLITPDFRRQLGQAAIAIAREVGYVNAGTVEFLVPEQVPGNTLEFYFLEMNTRLQVEHPVTELVTGLDLVREQLQVAAGMPLSFDQDTVQWRGHALECRICAEDPDQDFQPSPGVLSVLRRPSGPGVRVDSGVEADDTIPLEYDPLIAKLIVYGRTREEAVDRMLRALAEYRLGGVRTTIPFFQQLISHPAFRRGELHTDMIQELNLAALGPHPAHEKALAVLASVMAYREAQQNAAPTPAPPPGRWRGFPKGGWR